MAKKKSELYTIEKCECREDYDNGCMIPTDGGMYTAKDAIRILENGNGGTMRGVDSHRGFCVSYNRSDNGWLRKELKV